MKKLVIIAITIFSFSFSQIDAFPWQFQRLLLLENGTIIKVVDLIYDTHIIAKEPVKRPSKRQRMMLTKEEQQSLTKSERTLLATLLKIAQQEPKKALLWEYGETIREAKKFHSPEVNVFLDYAGWVMETELKKENNDKMIFVDADTYRRDILLPFLLQFESHFIIESTESLLKLIEYYQSLIDPKMSPIERDLAKVEAINPVVYKKLHIIWKTYKKELENLNSTLQKIVHENPQIQVGVLIEQLDTKKRALPKNQAQILFASVSKIMNLEMIIKIFVVPEKHVIIYAGGAHCEDVDQMLEKDLNFKVVINVGGTISSLRLQEIRDRQETGYFVRLLPAVWDNFLQEKLEDSLKRYTKGGFIRLLPENFAHQMDELYKMYNDKNVHERVVLKKTKQMLEQGFKAQVDMANASTTSLDTLLHAAVSANRVEVAKFLLTHGANPNIPEAAYGLTPLHIASAENNVPMVRLLLQFSADKTMHDKMGRTPYQRGKLMGKNNEEILRLLQTKESSD